MHTEGLGLAASCAALRMVTSYCHLLSSIFHPSWKCYGWTKACLFLVSKCFG